MVYLLKTNKKKGWKRSLFLITVFFLLIFLFKLRALNFLNPLFVKIAEPVSFLANKSLDGGSYSLGFFTLKKNLIVENEFLKKEASKNALLLANKKILVDENMALKKILGRENFEVESLLANVILKPGLSFYDSLIIDVGMDYMLNKGDKVLVEDILLGEIEEVYAKTSKVKLYSFPGDKLEVALGFTKILTIAHAKGGGVYEIKLPQGTGVIEGDVLTLPEEDLKILALVEEIIINPEDPFETILCKSPINLFELRWVQIIRE